MNAWGLVATVLLLIANGFFVAAEFAVIAASPAKLEPLADRGSRTARAALRTTRQLQLQLAGAQLGITIASLALGLVGEPAVAHLLDAALEPWVPLPKGVIHTISFTVSFTIVVFLHIIVGEMIPKNIAITAPERTLLSLVAPYRLYIWLFRPLIFTLNKLSEWGARLCGVQPRDELETAHTAEEIGAMVAASAAEGLIEDFDHRLLAGALDFDEKSVSAVMIPRDDIVAVHRSSTVADVERVVVSSGHSRLLVVGGDLDDVEGFVHAKDLLQVAPEGHRRALPLRLIRTMLVVSGDQSLEEVLLLMQRSRLHFAVVVDDVDEEVTVGLVTLEDILEELVGEINDETDELAR